MKSKGKELNRNFSKDEMQMTDKHLCAYIQIFNNCSRQGNENQNCTEISLSPIRKSKTNTKQNKK